MDGLGPLLSSQQQLVARRQLLPLGIEWEGVRNQVAARRWVVVHTPRVIGTTTGALTWEQRCWLAVLHAGPRSLLGGPSAAEAHCLTGWHIAGGAHSGAEIDVRRMCRRFGLRLPDRQRPRLDRAGKRRWTDCEWDLPDGSVLVL